MIRRGLTLLELLITLALVLALAALAMPALLDGLEERSFESTAEAICTQIMLARAEAQQTGRAVEIVYRPSPRSVMALHVVEPPDDVPIAGRGAPEIPKVTAGTAKSATPGGTAAILGLAGDDAARLLTTSWAEQLLGKGQRLQANQPRHDAGAEAAPAIPGPDEPPISTEAGSDQPMRVAVLLPDGSALMDRPVWLTDDSGRAVKIITNALTGAAEVERPSAAPAHPPASAPVPFVDSPAAPAPSPS